MEMDWYRQTTHSFFKMNEWNVNVLQNIFNVVKTRKKLIIASYRR